ncbi:MAG: hypothetical protein U0872_00175 [Planctomycetaceae bacterium]
MRNLRNSAWGTSLLLYMLGPLLFIGFLWFMMRRNSDPLGTGMLGNFIRSPAKRFRATDHPTTFDDVAAMEQAKAEPAGNRRIPQNPREISTTRAHRFPRVSC